MGNKSTGPAEYETMCRAVDWPVGAAVCQALGTMGFRGAIPWTVIDRAVDDAAGWAVDQAVFSSHWDDPKHHALEDFLEGVEAR